MRTGLLPLTSSPPSSSSSTPSLTHEARYLSLLLTAALIATKDSPALLKHSNTFICLNLSILSLGSFLYIPITSLLTRENDTSMVILLGRLLFCVYTPIMYIYISAFARCSPGIVSLLQDLASREVRSSNEHSNPCHKKYPVQAIVVVVMTLCVMNVLVSVFSPDIATSVLGVSQSHVFMVYLHTTVYFLSCGWLLPIPFVFLGCKLLTDKVKYLIAYVHTEFKTIRSSDDSRNVVDLAYVMAWHDELYEKNRLLNKILSGMVTLCTCFLAVASTTIAISIAIEGFTANLMFWFMSNTIILASTCYPAAELEIQNKLLSIELGALPMPAREMPNLNLYLNLYQSCAIKTSRSEFGIFVKGTKIRITFLALMRVGSITLSAIIFLGSLLQTAN